MNILNNPEIVNEVQQLHYDCEGSESISTAIATIISFDGTQYQLQLTLTKNELDILPDDDLPTYQLNEDGDRFFQI